MNKKFVTISTYPEVKRILKLVAGIKRWQLNTLMCYIAQLFSVAMDIDYENSDIEDLRETYKNWEIAVLPELRGNENE